MGCFSVRSFLKVFLWKLNSLVWPVYLDTSSTVYLELIHNSNSSVSPAQQYSSYCGQLKLCIIRTWRNFCFLHVDSFIRTIAICYDAWKNCLCYWLWFCEETGQKKIFSYVRNTRLHGILSYRLNFKLLQFILNFFHHTCTIFLLTYPNVET